MMSGAASESALRNSSFPFNLSGVSTFMPSSSAASFTGQDCSFLPRSFALSGLVTARTTSCPAAHRALRGGTAKSGVPMYTIFICYSSSLSA